MVDVFTNMGYYYSIISSDPLVIRTLFQHHYDSNNNNNNFYAVSAIQTNTQTRTVQCNERTNVYVAYRCVDESGNERQREKSTKENKINNNNVNEMFYL